MKIFESQHDFTTSLRAALTDIDPQWDHYRGLIVPGSHTPYQVEEKIEEIYKARLYELPFLGICLGHQLAAIEYARNILGIADATSEEFGDEGTPVVTKRKHGMKVGEVDGETYWSNYDVSIGWTKPPHFFTAPFHPEYQSSKAKPHWLLVAFLNYARSV